MSELSIPTILIAGPNGQVGWELQRTLLPLGRIVPMDRQELDLANNDMIRLVMRQVKPDVIVNAAAYTAIDKAEEEQDLAMQINGTAPGILKEKTFQSGTYNLTSSGTTTWHGFAETINEIAGKLKGYSEFLKIKRVEKIATDEYPTPATRPLNSALEITRLQQKFGLLMPAWDRALALCMEELS